MPVAIHPVPSEIADAIPFAEDERHASNDGDQQRALWRALVATQRVFMRFRGRLQG